MKKLLTICIVIAIILSLAQIAGAGVVVSWDESIQRGGDLDNAGTGALEYSAFEAALEGAGHTVLPGISELTAGNLAGVDLFFHGTNSHILTVSEETVISDFVENGGCVIVETDSPTAAEQASGNSLLAALGLGSPYNGHGGNGSGLFSNNDTWTTNGPVGDLRGLGFDLVSGFAGNVSVGSGTIVATSSGPINVMVEFEPYGPSGGRVLAVGSPFGFNTFQKSGGPLYSPNVQPAYLNFFECQLENSILTVEVDIKPGSCPNPFNPKSRGVVPVAIVGSADLDVDDIDPASICLVTPSGDIVCALDDYEIVDSTEPSDSDPEDCYDCFDADANLNCDLSDDGVDENDSYCGDGYDDLVVRFDAQDLKDAIGEADPDDCVLLVLIGNLNSGRDLTGGDSIVILKEIKP